jgi:hypothetical protein
MGRGWRRVHHLGAAPLPPAKAPVRVQRAGVHYYPKATIKQPGMVVVVHQPTPPPPEAVEGRAQKWWHAAVVQGASQGVAQAGSLFALAIIGLFWQKAKLPKLDTTPFDGK